MYGDRVRGVSVSGERDLERVVSAGGDARILFKTGDASSAFVSTVTPFVSDGMTGLVVPECCGSCTEVGDVGAGKTSASLGA